jgi:hypothetical protein
MRTKNQVKYNNYKAWLLWECVECKPRKKKL